MDDRYEQGRRYERSQYDRNMRDDSYYDRNERYDPRYDAYARDDRYDPQFRHGRNARRERSPSPRRYQDSYRDRYEDRHTGYAFRGAASGDAYRPEQRQDSFTFRAPGPQAPRFPSPDRNARPPQRQRPRQDRGQRGPENQRRGGAQAGRGRGGFRPRPGHARDILHQSGRATTPEQLEGMNPQGQARFMAIESSNEDSDDVNSVIDLTNDSDVEEGEVPRKRVKAEASYAPPEIVVPKWSNPDPYTSLPPPESLGAPKKDIVQVIRKAKVDSAPKSDSANAVKDNVDFISFNFDEDFADDDRFDDRSSPASEVPVPANAPTGPAAMTRPTKASENHVSNGVSFNLGNHKTSFQPSNAYNSKPDLDDGVGPPPPPPAGLMMPSDGELAAQYGGGGKKGKKRKREEQSKGQGDILPEWEPDESDSTPWCSDHLIPSHTTGFRLHKEICDFFEFVRPHDYEEAARQDLIARVNHAVQNYSGLKDAKNVEIRSFGSFAAGVYLPTADMDLVAVSSSFMQQDKKLFCQTKNQMWKLVKYIENSGLAAPGTVSPVINARVPIIKFTDKKTGIKVDISFENKSGLVANRTVEIWKQEYPAMPVIVLLIKQLLAMRGLNEVFTGGLGGFSIICLVVNMMAMMPEYQSGDMNADQHYSDLLMRFLDLYGNKIDIRSTGITMDPPGYYDKIKHPKKKQNANNLTIIDPNDPGNDISGGSRNIDQVLDVFRVAYHALQRRVHDIHNFKNVEWSILGCMWGGNYSSFIQQRNKLSRLHRGYEVIPALAALPPPPPARYGGKQQPPAPKPQSKLPEPPGGQLQGAAQGRQVPTKRRNEDSGLDDQTRKRLREGEALMRAHSSTFKVLFPNIPNVPDLLSWNYIKYLSKEYDFVVDSIKGFFTWDAGTPPPDDDDGQLESPASPPESPEPKQSRTEKRRQKTSDRHTSTRLTVKQRNASRAAAFKECFPLVPGVTNTLDRGEVRRLIAEHGLSNEEWQKYFSRFQSKTTFNVKTSKPPIDRATKEKAKTITKSRRAMAVQTLYPQIPDVPDTLTATQAKAIGQVWGFKNKHLSRFIQSMAEAERDL